MSIRGCTLFWTLAKMRTSQGKEKRMLLKHSLSRIGLWGEAGSSWLAAMDDSGIRFQTLIRIFGKCSAIKPQKGLIHMIHGLGMRA